jgi:hypothetical protein
MQQGSSFVASICCSASCSGPLSERVPIPAPEVVLEQPYTVTRRIRQLGKAEPVLLAQRGHIRSEDKFCRLTYHNS